MAADYLTELKYLGLIARIKRLSDGTLADGREVFRHINISIEPNWFLVFRIIIEKEETTITEICSILKFSHPSIISIVKKMEKSGYLAITTHSIDKRKQVIRLSEKAHKQLPEMQRIWDACEMGVKSVFGNDDFINELEKIEKAFENESFFERVMKHLGDNNIIIEPFTTKDTKKFSILNQEWLTKYFTIEPIDELVLNNPTENIIEKGGHIIMAKVRGETVGTAALIPKNKTEIELCRMAVSPNYQRIGIGKRLLQEAIQIAESLSYKSVILYSNTKLIPAINLYKQFGFKDVKLEEGVIYNRANIKMKLNISV